MYVAKFKPMYSTLNNTMIIMNEVTQLITLHFMVVCGGMEIE